MSPPRYFRRSCLLYGIVFVVVLPLLLVGGIALFFVVRDASAQKELNARIEQLQASGAPVDDATLQQFYHDHTSDEYTQAWLGLLAELESSEFKQSMNGVPMFDGSLEGDIPTHGEWPEEEDTRAFLQRWQDLHDRVMRLAMESKAVRFPIEFESIATLLTQTQEMRQAARLLSLRGKLAIYDRDPAAARRSIVALLGAAKVSQGEPILVSQLVSIAIDGMALEILKRAVEQNVLRPRDLRDVLEIIKADVSVGPEWQLAMQGERAMMLPIYRNPSLLGNFEPGSISLPFRSRDALHYLDLMDGVLELSSDDMDDFLRGLEKQEAELQAIVGGGLLDKLDSVLTGLLTPAVAAAGDAFVRKALQHRLASLAVGVRLYEAEHGAFPDSLDALTIYGLSPEALAASGGESFGYRVEEGSAWLWGIDRQSGLTSIPEDPPQISPGDAYADRQRQWIWTLPVAESPAAESPQDAVAPIRAP